MGNVDFAAVSNGNCRGGRGKGTPSNAYLGAASKPCEFHLTDPPRPPPPLRAAPSVDFLAERDLQAPPVVIFVGFGQCPCATRSYVNGLNLPI